MPALPLDEAGKYVASAYLVIFTVLLVYVAVLAAKMSRIERELHTLTELADKNSDVERQEEVASDERS